jgi:16S rRNA C1402 (ribose-2'-O) methylase RsmI
MFGINLTTDSQQVIRGTLSNIKKYIENNQIFGNLCIVVDGIKNNLII